MGFSTKCEACGENLNKFETLSVYQSVINGGIIECKKCKARYKSKFKTAWCNGVVGLESIVFLCAVVVAIAIEPIWRWISKLTAKEPNFAEKMYMQYKAQSRSFGDTVEQINSQLLQTINAIENRENFFWYCLFGVFIFIILFRVAMTYYIPLRKIEGKDEDFFDIRQKD